MFRGNVSAALTCIRFDLSPISGLTLVTSVTLTQPDNGALTSPIEDKHPTVTGSIKSDYVTPHFQKVRERNRDLNLTLTKDLESKSNEGITFPLLLFCLHFFLNQLHPDSS